MGTRMSSSRSTLSSGHTAPPRGSASLLSLFSLLRLALAGARGSCSWNPQAEGRREVSEHLLLGWEPPPLPPSSPWPTVFFAGCSFLNFLLIDKTSMGQADPVFSL